MSASNETRPKGEKLYLFLPIETKAREMDAKILLACVAAERGHRSVVGDMRELTGFVEFLPKGVYISKSIPEKVERDFRKMRSLGYGVSSWCEEGLVFRSRTDYQREKVSTGALNQLDLFFAWGGNQALAITEKAPQVKRRIREVGNPRTDLIRPPYKRIYEGDARRLRSRYGDFILFNTNFSIANNVLGTEQAFVDFEKRGKVKSKMDEEKYWAFHDHKLTLLNEMKALVEDMSTSFPDRKIIVRPHPSENHDTWKEFVKPFNNVEMVFQGSAIPWLMAADVLIHNGCTTGIEAYFLETPAIAYRPVVKAGFELELPNSVSLQASNSDEVRQLIEALGTDQNGYARWRTSVAETLKLHMADTEYGWASDRIVDELEKYYGSNPLEHEPALYRWGRWLRRRSIDSLRAVKRTVVSNESEPVSPGEKHRRQRLPGLDIEEVASLIALLRQASGRFENVAVKPIRRTERCFLIESVRQ